MGDSTGTSALVPPSLPLPSSTNMSHTGHLRVLLPAGLSCPTGPCTLTDQHPHGPFVPARPPLTSDLHTDGLAYVCLPLTLVPMSVLVPRGQVPLLPSPLLPPHCLPLSLPEAPVTIVQAPRDLEVTEGDTATFECELSQALADVTWEKVRAQPSPPQPLTTVVMPPTRTLEY